MNSFRPLTFRESASSTAWTGAEMLTTHSTSRSNDDARTAWPPIEAPTSAISFAPDRFSQAFAARRSATVDSGVVLPVDPSYPRKFSASAGTPRATNRGAMSRHPVASQLWP